MNSTHWLFVAAAVLIFAAADISRATRSGLRKLLARRSSSLALPISPAAEATYFACFGLLLMLWADKGFPYGRFRDRLWRGKTFASTATGPAMGYGGTGA